MPESLTRSAIRNVSTTCAEGLRPFGFARQSPHLVRQSKDVFHGIHFQSSQWGSAEAGRFTINLTVTSPLLYEGWTGRPLPANPATALWPIQQRLGFVCPEHGDIWWDVSIQTDVAKLSVELKRRLHEYGLPFFDRFSSLSDILAIAERGEILPGMFEPQMSLVAAMLLANEGRKGAAKERLSQAFAASSEAFHDAVKRVAKRLNISL